MQKTSLLYASFAVLLVLLFLHLAGTFFYFYWSLDWYDSLVHFIGGVSMGLLTLWLWLQSGLFAKRIITTKGIIIVALIVVVIIGLGWEVFEYVNGLTQSTEGYKPDTIHDLIADTLGALVAGIWSSKKLTHDN